MRTYRFKGQESRNCGFWYSLYRASGRSGFRKWLRCDIRRRKSSCFRDRTNRFVFSITVITALLICPSVICQTNLRISVTGDVTYMDVKFLETALGRLEALKPLTPIEESRGRIIMEGQFKDSSSELQSLITSLSANRFSVSNRQEGDLLLIMISPLDPNLSDN